MDVKGVMFYKGRDDLCTDDFVHVYFERDTNNAHHCKAFFVKLCSSNKILGHPCLSTAEAIHEIYEESSKILWVSIYVLAV